MPCVTSHGSFFVVMTGGLSMLGAVVGVCGGIYTSLSHIVKYSFILLYASVYLGAPTGSRHGFKGLSGQ
jgi:hypothetical protein